MERAARPAAMGAIITIFYRKKKGRGRRVVGEIRGTTKLVSKEKKRVDGVGTIKLVRSGPV